VRHRPSLKSLYQDLVTGGLDRIRRELETGSYGTLSAVRVLCGALLTLAPPEAPADITGFALRDAGLARLAAGPAR
jgi:hypothetical protein